MAVKYINQDGTVSTVAQQPVEINNIKNEIHLPIATIISSPLDSLSGFLLCDGAEISRLDYKELFEAIGTTYGEGNSATTFNVPDFRGMFLRGLGGNSEAIGVVQEDAIQPITGEIGPFPYGSPSVASGSFRSEYTTSPQQNSSDGIRQNYGLFNIDSSRQTRTADENRPVNQAINYFIKSTLDAYTQDIRNLDSEIQDLKSQVSSIPLGSVVPFAGATAPVGFMFPEGQELAKVSFPELFSKIGYTYGGSGEVFNLPDLRGLFLRGTGGNAEALGVVQEEHLPNIYGTNISQRAPSSVTGVFEIIGTSDYGIDGSATDGPNIAINASLMNYGTEEEPRYIYTDDPEKQHVTPVNMSVNYIMKVRPDAYSEDLRNLDEEIEELKSQLSAVPLGSIVPYMGLVAPSGFMFPQGQELNVVDYPELFKHIGYTYGGTGDVFNLPDMRGLFIRGLGGDSDTLGVVQAEHLPNIEGTLSLSGGGNGSTSTGVFSSTVTSGFGHNQSGLDKANIIFSASSMNYGTDEDPISIYTDDPEKQHVTPVNMAVNYIMKVKTDAYTEDLRNLDTEIEKLKSEILNSGINVPVGTIIDSLEENIEGYIRLEGQELNKIEFAGLNALYESIGYPNGYTETTFNLIDARNRVTRTVGDLTGLVGETQEDAMQRIYGHLESINLGNSVSGCFYNGTTRLVDGYGDTGGYYYQQRIMDSSLVSRTADETRVKSFATYKHQKY